MSTLIAYIFAYGGFALQAVRIIYAYFKTKH